MAIVSRKSKIVTENVYSPIDDSKMSRNVVGSKVWDICFKEEDVTKELLTKHPKMFIYTVKFDGLTPIQVTKIKKVK